MVFGPLVGHAVIHLVAQCQIGPSFYQPLGQRQVPAVAGYVEGGSLEVSSMPTVRIDGRTLVQKPVDHFEMVVCGGPDDGASPVGNAVDVGASIDAVFAGLYELRERIFPLARSDLPQVFVKRLPVIEAVFAGDTSQAVSMFGLSLAIPCADRRSTATEKPADASSTSFFVYSS